MKPFKILLLTTVLFFFYSTLYATADSTQLTQLLGPIQTIQADFLQNMVDKDGKVIQKSTGHMVIQRPGKFLWQIKKPTPQLIITDGKRLWIYDPDLEQVTIRALNKAVGETPALLLSDSAASIEKSFQVHALKNNVSTMRWFSLIPKDKSSVLASVQIGFLNNQLHTMKLEDHLGHSTDIQFQALKINAAIPAKTFTFTPPANIDVIDETKRGS